MDLPTEFLDLGEMMSLAGLAAIVFLIVQATKELKFIKDLATILWAWGVAFSLLFAGQWIQAGEITAELVYLSVANSILAAAVAVGLHQGLKRFGAVKD